MPPPVIYRLSDISHELLQPFKTLIQSGEEGSDGFVAEGRILIETLAAAGITFQAILVSERYVAAINKEFAEIKTDHWIVVPNEFIHEICGFRFHGGMLAIGKRPAVVSLEEIVTRHTDEDSLRIVVCSSVTNQDNLGVILRSAKAFGMNAVITTVDAGDLLSRRCLRQSMGAGLLVSNSQVSDVSAAIRSLRDKDVQVFGASLGAGALPFQQIKVPRRFALVLGNEAMGLSKEVESLCDERIYIKMAPGHDSLNVAVAGGILMQHFAQPFLA